MSTVLLTFTGFHDPFAKGLVGEEEQPGPVVTLAREVHFDRLVLFSTPGTAKHSAATREAVNQISPDTDVQIEDFPLLDPTDYEAIRQSLLAWIDKNRKSESVDEYCVSIASGTPQMHVTWLTLVASGQLRARILNTRPPRYVTKEKPLISEVRVFPNPFPLAAASVHDAVASASSSTSVSAHSDASFVQSKYDLQKGERPIVVIGESRAETAQHDIRKAAQVLGMIGEHPEFLKIIEKAGLLAPTRYPVLILGETGTGKELLARLIHHLSGRTAESFIPLNCAAIPKELVESTLFGHKRGSFTGASDDRKGKFDTANGGTLFLDELGELPVEVQPKFLRVLQDGVVEPIGQAKGHKVDVRIIAATNVDVEKAIRSGRLREDLFYRLKVGICQLPPLRQRRSDIQRVALHVLTRVNASVRHPKRLSPEALAWLISRPWPGNIRDLENTIEGAAILTAGPQIDVAQLEMVGGDFAFVGPTPSLPDVAEGFSMPDYLSQTRRQLIDRALQIADGKQSQAAKLLGITPQALNKQLNTMH